VPHISNVTMRLMRTLHEAKIVATHFAQKW